jgi:hypothetical protein
MIYYPGYPRDTCIHHNGECPVAKYSLTVNGEMRSVLSTRGWNLKFQSSLSILPLTRYSYHP